MDASHLLTYYSLHLHFEGTAHINSFDPVRKGFWDTVLNGVGNNGGGNGGNPEDGGDDGNRGNRRRNDDDNRRPEEPRPPQENEGNDGIKDTQKLHDYFREYRGQRINKTKINFKRIPNAEQRRANIPQYELKRILLHVKSENPLIFNANSPHSTVINDSLLRAIRDINKNYPKSWPRRHW